MFHPALKRGGSAELPVVLYRYWEGKRRELRFKRCANFEIIVDTEVLAGNAPPNTAVLEATANIDAIRQMMRKQKRNWNVAYEKSIDPLLAKVNGADQYVLFTIRLFGGVLNILARSFTNKRLMPQSIQTR